MSFTLDENIEQTALGDGEHEETEALTAEEADGIITAEAEALTAEETDGIITAEAEALTAEEADGIITAEVGEPEVAANEMTLHERGASEVIMEDLEELIAEFPELSDLRDASELSDPLRYAKLRDLGLSPKEAYLATSGRKRAIDTRAHLSGARPKPLNTPPNISAYAVRCVRELFDGISDEEIISLYKRVNG